MCMKNEKSRRKKAAAAKCKDNPNPTNIACWQMERCNAVLVEWKTKEIDSGDDRMSWDN